MSYSQTLTLKTVDFRQNYTPEHEPTATKRHWTLDFQPGRDLLKAALRKHSPEEKVPYFGEDAYLDAKLEEIVDIIGLRDMAVPTTNVEKLRAAAKFVKGTFLLQFGLVK